jgi:hypothetical protein
MLPTVGLIKVMQLDRLQKQEVLHLPLLLAQRKHPRLAFSPIKSKKKVVSSLLAKNMQTHP